jgi:primosomal protein N' (replication factor Y)
MSYQTNALPKPLLAEPGSTYGNNQPPKSSPSPQWIEVLVDVPLQQSPSTDEEEEKLYTYKLPPELNVKPGDILIVPFGSQQVGAIAIRYISQPPADLSIDKIKNILDVIESNFFPPTYWQLLELTANYYQTPLIRVIRTSLPPGLLKRSQRRIRLIPDAIPTGGEVFLNTGAAQILDILQNSKSGDYTWTHIKSKVKSASRGLKDLLQRGWVESYLETPPPPRAKMQQAVSLLVQHLPKDLTASQQKVMEQLRRRGDDMWMTDLLKACSTSSSVVKKLEEKGYVVIDEREVLRREGGRGDRADKAKTLTRHQQQALATINSIDGFARVLLHGVTGSGKTEVYLQAIAPILERGQSVLVLVPEIGLTPQLTDRFRARFGKKVFVYHSALSAGERYDTWRNMTRGVPQVIVGTRSAIFAPLPKLGLIVLDEEHDSSFKQDQPAPCYHARTVARWRAELENCPLILGSATPSLESWQDARQGRSEVRGQRSEVISDRPSSTHPLNPLQNPLPTDYYLSLPDRVAARPMPPVEIVDMREQLRRRNRSIFSYPLQNALRQIQEEGKQGILFIHRRGHSTFVSCRSCGYVMECPHCDVSLSYHYTHEGATPLLRCHYCNYTQQQHERCPECDSPFFKFFGSGTQKVELELQKLFPELRPLRYDSDTTRTKDAHRIILEQFANREADLLIGTQMLTKGLDLAGVTLVGVVSADGLLHFSDYRASERAFQTLLQVAGRAGRGEDPGRVIIQTYTPEHPVIEAVRRHDYESFAMAELMGRQDLNYPPFGRLILLRLSGYDPTEVASCAQQLAAYLTPRDGGEFGGYELLGPAPAPILRVANRYRWQILLKLPGDGSERLPFLPGLRDRVPRSISLTVDVEPLNLG